MINKVKFGVTTVNFVFIGDALDSAKRNMISQYLMVLNLSIVKIS